MIYTQLVRAEGRDAFIVIAIVLLCTYAVSRAVFPKVFSGIIAPNKLFGFRVREDLGSNLRPFSSEHLYFTALSSLSLSFVILFIANGLWKDNGLPEILIVDHFGFAILQWLGLFVVLNVLVYVKFLLILGFGLLFDLRSTISRHFVDMVNASLVFFLIVLLFLAVISFSFIVFPKNLIQFTLAASIIFFYYRGFLIYMRMLNDRPHSKLFIFSYICATELTPLTIGLVLIINSQI
ncbi:DUF4271 domain-containing protein [uncultured Roseivirga sp.]|uniref:DUF4271 domain-containing protein n=1 Tax=uncultured Roseivirga sp. TaxID=543088 RepID=UPI0030DB2D75|tara:strand:+ start:24 stop:731 length:708 start_codon:yes stop_codon:yes gene_type:complete